MPLSERKRQMIRQLLDLGIGKVQIARAVGCSHPTVIAISKGRITRYVPSPLEIERMKAEIQAGWSEGVRRVRLRKRDS